MLFLVFFCVFIVFFDFGKIFRFAFLGGFLPGDFGFLLEFLFNSEKFLILS